MIRITSLRPDFINFWFHNQSFIRTMTTALPITLINQMDSHKSCAEYHESIATLNSLQSNQAVIEQSRKERAINAWKNVAHTKFFVNCCGITDEQINNLNIIHVSGTKGKGSTCAFTESILRSHGLKTGFYSSPHLIAARERIRINGRPISESMFTNYFWNTYNCIKNRRRVPKDRSQTTAGDFSDSVTVSANNQSNLRSKSMSTTDPDDAPQFPAYFMFLTTMAMNVFVKEQVDVAIIEVGIGGEFDCTNFITKPVVCGVTSLGLDHTAILGNTIQKIAWNKSGIFKEGVPAVSVDQEPAAMNVLKRRSTERMVPSFETVHVIEFSSKGIKLGIPGIVQNVNASLAVALSQKWMQSMNGQVVQGRKLNLKDSKRSKSDSSQEFISGLEKCRWPGRYHTLKRTINGHRFNYFLDGAHTVESINTCLEWFRSASKADHVLNGNFDGRNRKVTKVLLFNCTGNRDAEKLISPFLAEQFDLVTFSTNKPRITKSKDSDNSNFTIDEEEEIKKVQQLSQLWNRLRNDKTDLSNGCQDCGHQATVRNESRTFACLSDALQFIESATNIESDVQVLVTGSLHLVGGVLEILDPELASCC